MNIYIFENVKQLTTRHHSGGGLIVIAKSAERIDDIIKLKNKAIDKWEGELYDIQLSDDDWNNCKSYPISIPVDEMCIVFPDAGCC